MKTFEQIVDETFKVDPLDHYGDTFWGSPFANRMQHFTLMNGTVYWEDRRSSAHWSHRKDRVIANKYENALKILKPYQSADISSPTEEICREILSSESRFVFVEEEMTQHSNKVVVKDILTNLSIEVPYRHIFFPNPVFEIESVYIMWDFNIYRDKELITEIFTSDERKLIGECVKEFASCKEEALRIKQEEEKRLKNEKIRQELTNSYSKGAV
tara:strand:+ start:201 stop:842 length:642 start_codon:yes stop_codon:yes gene_type:complete